MHDLARFFGQWKDFMLQVDYIRSLGTYAFVKQVYPAQTLQMLLHPVNANVSELSTYLIWSHPVKRWQPEVTLGMSKPWMKLGGKQYDKPIYSYSFQNSISFLPAVFRGCLKTIVNGSEFSESDNDSCNHEHFVGRFRRFLVVSTQPSEVFKPCESPLHDPSFLGRDKLSGII